MKWTLQASACLAAMLLAGCTGNRGNRSTGGAETGAMSDTSAAPSSDTGMRSGGMSSDTSRSGMTRSDTTSGMTRSDTTSGMTRSDTGMKADSSGKSSRMHSDSSKSNQTKSGVTNSKTGKSTLGPGATQTRPDQGQPVTSKGDTINKGVDSAR
jgi:hypothetical protein